MRRMREVRWALGGAVLAALGAGAASAPLAAQQGEITGQVVARVEDEGTPVTGLPMEIFNEGTSKPVGTTGSDGSVTLDMGLVDLPKGSPVEVVLRTCEGERRVVLVPRAESLPEEEDCDDNVLGVFLWGDRDVVIDVGTSTVTSQPPTGATPATGGTGAGFGRSLTLGAKADLASWTKLEDVACAVPGLTGCEVEDTSPFFSAFGELRLFGPLKLGASFSYGSYEFTQTASSGEMVTGDVDVTGLSGYGAVAAPRGWPVRPFGLLGVSQLWNDLRFQSSLEDPADRSESGPRLRLGGGLDVPLTNSLGLRANVDRVSGGERDADTHWRFGAGGFLTVWFK